VGAGKVPPALPSKRLILSFAVMLKDQPLVLLEEFVEDSTKTPYENQTVSPYSSIYSENGFFNPIATFTFLLIEI